VTRGSGSQGSSSHQNHFLFIWNQAGQVANIRMALHIQRILGQSSTEKERLKGRSIVLIKVLDYVAGAILKKIKIIN